VRVALIFALLALYALRYLPIRETPLMGPTA
jgi:hypothetical protein